MLALLVALPLFVQSTDSFPSAELDPSVRAADLAHYVGVLASDELGGRRTGTPGSVLAAHFLAEVLEEAGVAPAASGEDGASYYQHVPFGSTEFDAVPTLTCKAADGVHQGVLGVTFDLLSGIQAERDFRVLSVASLEDLPAEPSADVALFLDASSSDRRAWLEARGQSDGAGWGLLITRGPASEGRRERTEPPRAQRSIAACPVIRVRGDLRSLFQDGGVESVHYAAPGRTVEPECFNVVGKIEGVGTEERPELAQEVIVLSAHYDHLGIREGDGDDSIYNGADDDASGCAAVLELAHALAAGPPPARTVVFLLATGEEIGLVGTRFYLEEPVEPLENTVCNLNFEMIGRPDELVGGPGRLWLTGDELTNLGEGLRAQELTVAVDPRPDQNFFRRSDNYAFARIGIVAQTLSSYNLHEDYHTPRDEADTLDYEHMQECVETALHAVRWLASGDVAPEWKPGSNPAENR